MEELEAVLRKEAHSERRAAGGPSSASSAETEDGGGRMKWRPGWPGFAISVSCHSFSFGSQFCTAGSIISVLFF